MKIIRNITMESGGYRRVTRAEIERRGLVLEGADGDESTGTVTYWYVVPREH